jgi:hypothetical protein
VWIYHSPGRATAASRRAVRRYGIRRIRPDRLAPAGTESRCPSAAVRPGRVPGARREGSRVLLPAAAGLARRVCSEERGRSPSG